MKTLFLMVGVAAAQKMAMMYSPLSIPFGRRSLADGCGIGYTACSIDETACCQDGATCSLSGSTVVCLGTTCDFSVDVACGTGCCQNGQQCVNDRCAGGTTPTATISGTQSRTTSTRTSATSSSSSNSSDSSDLILEQCSTCDPIVSALTTCGDDDASCICSDAGFMEAVSPCAECIVNINATIAASLYVYQALCENYLTESSTSDLPQSSTSFTSNAITRQTNVASASASAASASASAQGQSSGSGKSISTGAIAGIAIAAVLIFVIIASLAIFFCIFKKKRNNSEDKQPMDYAPHQQQQQPAYYADQKSPQEQVYSPHTLDPASAKSPDGNVQSPDVAVLSPNNNVQSPLAEMGGEDTPRFEMASNERP